MSNSLANALPTIYGRILQVAQENSVMPRLITNNYSTEAAQKGQTIAINNVGASTVRDVTPGSVPNTNSVTSVAPTVKSLTLSYYREVAFNLSDADIANLVEGIPARQLEQAVADLVADVDKTIITTSYKSFYNFTGSAGTTPFASDAAVAQTAATVLNLAKAPTRERFIVLDPYAEGKAAQLAILRQADQSGQTQIWADGSINGKTALGWEWYQDQSVFASKHDTNASGTYAVDASGSIGDTSVVLDDGAGAGATLLVVGDKFTITGSTQQYTVTSVTANSPTANEDTYGISPALDQAIADGDSVTVVSTDYVPNLAFHRDAVHFASRMPRIDFPGGNVIQMISDPVSGLQLKLEVERQHRQTEWSVGILFGVVVPRPEWGVVIMG